MGIWKDVYLTASGPVALRHGFVNSKVDTGLDKATLTASVQVANATDHPVKGILKASFGTVRMQQPVELAAMETRSISFSADRFPQMNIRHPRLWWPYQMGTPELQQLQWKFEVGDKFLIRRPLASASARSPLNLTNKRTAQLQDQWQTAADPRWWVVVRYACCASRKIAATP